MPPVNHDALQDMYELMWWIRISYEDSQILDEDTKVHEGWWQRYAAICRVAKVAFKHIPLTEAIENFMLDWANNADWMDKVEDMLSHYRETCAETKS